MDTSPESSRQEDVEFSWRADRQELADRITEIVHWCRTEPTPQCTDRQIAEHAVNVMDEQRARNIRKFAATIKEMSQVDGVTPGEAAVTILKDWVRVAGDWKPPTGP